MTTLDEKRLNEVESYWKMNYGVGISNGDVDFLLTTVRRLQKQLGIAEQLNDALIDGLERTQHEKFWGSHLGIKTSEMLEQIEELEGE